MHCYCVIILQSDNPSAPTLRYGALQEGDDVTVMPQEDFTLYGLDGGYLVHINRRRLTIDTLESEVLRCLEDVWDDFCTRYDDCADSPLVIFAQMEKDHALQGCYECDLDSHGWDPMRNQHEEHHKDAMSVLRQLLEGEATVDGVPMNVDRAVQTRRLAMAA